MLTVLATSYIPGVNPIGWLSVLAALPVGSVLIGACLARKRSSPALRIVLGVGLLALLAAAAVTYGLPVRRSMCLYGEGDYELIVQQVALYVLLAGAFGAGLICVGCRSRWLAIEGLFVSVAACVGIAALAVHLAEQAYAPAMPFRIIALGCILVGTFAWSVGRVFRHVRRPDSAEQGGPQESEDRRPHA